MKWIYSEEERIRSKLKITELIDLQSPVCQKSFENFYWSIYCIEMISRPSANKLGANIDPVEFTADLSTATFSLNDFTYNIGCYVAILFDDSKSPFWMGKVESIVDNRNGAVELLKAHWLQAKERIYDSFYRVIFLKTFWKVQSSWLKTNFSNGVYLSFEILASKHRLSSAVHKKVW